MKPSRATKSRGVTILEAALTMPIVFMIVFFLLDVLRMNRTKVTIDTIAMEATLDFISSKNTDNFQTIIQKYKSINAVDDDIVYYFDIYPSLEALCAQAPYGGEEIFWPIKEERKDEEDKSVTITTITYSEGDYLDTNRDNGFMKRSNVSMELFDYGKPERNFASSKQKPFDTLAGKAFILTFVCNYKLSNILSKRLLSDGVNTVARSKLLLWGRGVGVCN
ncbi:MAG: pilus assembly protein [Holosporaceae bacterium]|jgi:hypothetical protein|nr:pilus assembly protein [Holosporaceae bacterium]